MKYFLIFIGIAAAVAITPVANAQNDAPNYKAAKEIMERDKQVRDYQAAQVGGYGFIYDDHTTGDIILKIVLFVVVIGGGGFWLFGIASEFISEFFIGRSCETKRELLNKYAAIKDKLIEDLTPTKFQELEVGETFFFKHAGGRSSFSDAPQSRCLAVTIGGGRCAFGKKGLPRVVGAIKLDPLTPVIRVRLPTDADNNNLAIAEVIKPVAKLKRTGLKIEKATRKTKDPIAAKHTRGPNKPKIDAA